MPDVEPVKLDVLLAAVGAASRLMAKTEDGYYAARDALNALPSDASAATVSAARLRRDSWLVAVKAANSHYNEIDRKVSELRWRHFAKAASLLKDAGKIIEEGAKELDKLMATIATAGEWATALHDLKRAFDTEEARVKKIEEALKPKPDDGTDGEGEE